MGDKRLLSKETEYIRLQVGTLTNRKMSELSKDTKFSMSIETIVSLESSYQYGYGILLFSLKAQIKEAMELPEPVISRQEYDLKDNAIRSEIMNNRELIEKNFEKLELIEQRVYELR